MCVNEACINVHTRSVTIATIYPQFTGPQLGSIVETVVSMLVAVVISAWASWVLTLVVLGFLAVMILAGLLNLLAASLLHVSRSKEAAGKVGKYLSLYHNDMYMIVEYIMATYILD